MSRMLAAVLLAWPAAFLCAQDAPDDSSADAAATPTRPPVVHTPAVNSALDLSELEEPVETPAPQSVQIPETAGPQSSQSDEPSATGPAPTRPVQGPPVAEATPARSQQRQAGAPEEDERPLTEIPRRANEGAATAKTERKSDSKALTPWYRNPLLGLGVVLVLIFAGVKLLRRYVPATRPLAPSVMRVVGRMALSSKQSVVLVHVGRRMVLVGVAGDRMVTLSEIDDAEEVCLLLGRLGDSTGMTVGEFDTRLAEQFGRYEVDHVDLPEDENGLEEGDEEELLRDARGHLQHLMTRLRSLQTT